MPSKIAISTKAPRIPPTIAAMLVFGAEVEVLGELPEEEEEVGVPVWRMPPM